MKILILSDTHKNQKILCQILKNEIDNDYIFHLGDDYEDLDENFDLTKNAEIIKVPGIFHPGYLDGSLEKIQIVNIQNWQFLLVHNIEDISRTTADMILFGHTHDRTFQKGNFQYFLNPGHLKSLTHRNRKASYATLELNLNNIEITFKEIDSKQIEKFYIKK